MTYRQRLSLFTFIDSCIILTAMIVSAILIGFSIKIISFSFLISSFSIILSHHLLSFNFKLYKKSWEYASIGELVLIFKIVSYSVLIGTTVLLVASQQINIRLMAVIWLLNFMLIGASRLAWRVFRDRYIKSDDGTKTLIIGAGAAGTMVARQLLKYESNLNPVAFIDDNHRKQKLHILGIPVIGGTKAIAYAVDKLNIEHIIIAIPSLTKRELNKIFQECAKTKAKTQILPMLEDLVTGKVSVKQFRDVQVEDLLGRETVEIDIESISDYVTNKVVLVSGAGGSIGSEISRQVSRFKPKQLILLGHGENSIYSVEMELKEALNDSNIDIVPVIADLQDKQKMLLVMNEFKPDVVYHAAAHKHVPLMERNPEEAVKNNLIGTMNIAKAASWARVKTFVMISSDKAVNPTSVMGSTKRLSEMVIQGMNQKSSTRFVAVRFGNVLGSRGSVIPLFKKQIEKGGPVTVTHPDMVRYFMTIPEASRLVIQAGALAKGGEIFVLDMGEPVKIVDLAQNLIKLSGNSIDDIGIAFTGMRPGEKLYEELLKEDEIHEQQIYPNIYIGKTSYLCLADIDRLVETFMEMDREELRLILVDLANRKKTHDSRSVVSVSS